MNATVFLALFAFASAALASATFDANVRFREFLLEYDTEYKVGFLIDHEIVESAASPLDAQLYDGFQNKRDEYIHEKEEKHECITDEDVTEIIDMLTVKYNALTSLFPGLTDVDALYDLFRITLDARKYKIFMNYLDAKLGDAPQIAGIDADGFTPQVERCAAFKQPDLWRLMSNAHVIRKFSGPLKAAINAFSEKAALVKDLSEQKVENIFSKLDSETTSIILLKKRAIIASFSLEDLEAAISQPEVEETYTLGDGIGSRTLTQLDTGSSSPAAGTKPFNFGLWITVALVCIMAVSVAAYFGINALRDGDDEEIEV
jgi:hypothetical protein